MNPLPYFGQGTVWPRGFPLHLIREAAPTTATAWDATDGAADMEGPQAMYLRPRTVVSVLVQQLLAQKVHFSTLAPALLWTLV